MMQQVPMSFKNFTYQSLCSKVKLGNEQLVHEGVRYKGERANEERKLAIPKGIKHQQLSKQTRPCNRTPKSFKTKQCNNLSLQNHKLKRGMKYSSPKTRCPPKTKKKTWKGRLNR
ncbi:hypothetical protein Syun_020422 [Stephania yunnanensis]|uniref:Uncharacterized protein n=1 Tax=Stephania yunnanensis TaxID=152371 RepID=A0AAP0IEG3_9MAGN